MNINSPRHLLRLSLDFRPSPSSSSLVYPLVFAFPARSFAAHTHFFHPFRSLVWKKECSLSLSSQLLSQYSPSLLAVSSSVFTCEIFAPPITTLTTSFLPLSTYTAALAADCVRTYTVVDGDICDSISAANNASTYQLAAINTDTIDSTCGNLQPGSSICLGTDGEDCQTTYVVQQEDTCDAIASAHGINSTMLYTNNPNIDEDCANIYVGEVSL